MPPPEPVERVCEVCSQTIPSWKAKSEIVCSVKCKFERREVAAKQKREAQIQKRPKDGRISFHSCIPGGGGGVDPYVLERCRCRKLVSEEQAKSLVSRGEALDLETRRPIFTGGAIVQIGKLLRTPRSATVESAHISRLVETGSAIKAKNKYSEKQLRAMHDALELDKRDRAQEESMRLEIYGELTASARRAWIVEVPSNVYDAAERRDWGRPLFTNYKDDRTPGGIGVDVDSLLSNDEFEHFESETETEKEDSEQSDDERTADEVLAEYREN